MRGSPAHLRLASALASGLSNYQSVRRRANEVDRIIGGNRNNLISIADANDFLDSIGGAAV